MSRSLSMIPTPPSARLGSFPSRTRHLFSRLLHCAPPPRLAAGEMSRAAGSDRVDSAICPCAQLQAAGCVGEGERSLRCFCCPSTCSVSLVLETIPVAPGATIPAQGPLNEQQSHMLLTPYVSLSLLSLSRMGQVGGRRRIPGAVAAAIVSLPGAE
ncbi:hypothetical protein XELAEV_18031982mg [Xenopus laevis]|uniref:Uncharacterized protein n=1 Tax=Xenopus laevis TaxID=8355 RepID=A0A974CNS2_XENLA|nr:hypothetical protein XELAEV_18031982mg [Xenopus laevis]